MIYATKSPAALSGRPPISDVDVLVVGGGPIGLSVALGLMQRGARTLVVERDSPPAAEAPSLLTDWSKTFTYRLDCRGMDVMDALGVTSDLEASGDRGGTGGEMHFVSPDGTRRSIPGRLAKGRVIMLQRAQLLRVLRGRLARASQLQGTVEDVTFPPDRHGVASVQISGPNGSQIITCRCLIGCDGIRSTVRKVLASKVDRSFRTKSIRCPSGGLVFRSLMMQNLEDTSLKDFVSFRGKTGHSASMLTFHETLDSKETGLLRPLSMARRPNYFLFKCKSVDDVYARLDAEFPQLNARERISVEAVEAFLASKGTTFPSPTWAKRSACVVNGVSVAIIGDALHAFGPDIGQGLNAGLLDVARLFDVLDECRQLDQSEAEFEERLASFSRERVREAESICRIIPVANPYTQYNLRGLGDRIRGHIFTINASCRSKLYAASVKISKAMGIPNVIFRPPITSLVVAEPPLQYSNILRQYRQNTAVVTSIMFALFLFAGKLFGWKTGLLRR